MTPLGAKTLAMSVAAGLVVASGASAFAQTDLRALRQRDEMLQQQDIARQDALAAQRERSAAQSRYDTQLTLRALNETATPPTRPMLRPALSPTPPRGPTADDMAADIARMDRLTDQALAAGNARLRAIKPAS
ncbi:MULTISPECIES: hypothetical protein [Caulobacter]|jgi:hypothetical protein|uniref:Uncharacterized protein n=1 Tax=Caulobacter rhizosphaerae TaxID=2010972 RepID=A0ABU1N4W3_9CAUL|nr:MULTISPECIES: hypothetical protein [Caulobacter]KQZ32048.1 hypothetical protein ASD47_15170 [Caulobacter sp. Root1472]MDR6533474.1 hypothetical protein [Caulobacter rhizosphaerae]GGL42072.1 hypothetical protein GCM10010983_44120 [Caulobacter rhizosphaerae]